ncbi:hypothetical protein DQE80_15625, partial [Enterococcus sp. HPCN18]
MGFVGCQAAWAMAARGAANAREARQAEPTRRRRAMDMDISVVFERQSHPHRCEVISHRTTERMTCPALFPANLSSPSRRPPAR